MKNWIGRTVGSGLIAGCAVLVPYHSGVGAEPLVAGRYEGSAEVAGGPVSANPRSRMTHFALTIQRVEGEAVTGTWSQSSGPCEGTHPVAGRFATGRLFLKATDPASSACRIPPFQLSADGGTLESSAGPFEMRLRR